MDCDCIVENILDVTSVIGCSIYYYDKKVNSIMNTI